MSTAAGISAPPGTTDVYSLGEDGTKTYLGWVTNKQKLARFFRAADCVLNPNEYEKHGHASKNRGQVQQVRRVPQPTKLLPIPNVDRRAAEIMIQWINNNNAESLIQFDLDHSLFGHRTASFETAIDVHRAMHASDLFSQPRGQVVRNAIFIYICNKVKSHFPSADDFKQCKVEKFNFDGFVFTCMMQNPMHRYVERTLDQAIIDEIKQYCCDTGRYGSIKAMGEGIVVMNIANYKCKKSTLESGW